MYNTVFSGCFINPSETKNNYFLLIQKYKLYCLQCYSKNDIEKLVNGSESAMSVTLLAVILVAPPAGREASPNRNSD